MVFHQLTPKCHLRSINSEHKDASNCSCHWSDFSFVLVVTWLGDWRSNSFHVDFSDFRSTVVSRRVHHKTFDTQSRLLCPAANFDLVRNLINRVRERGRSGLYQKYPTCQIQNQLLSKAWSAFTGEWGPSLPAIVQLQSPIHVERHSQLIQSLSRGNRVHSTEALSGHRL